MSEPSPSKRERAPAVGYIVSTWPRLSQTFVLNEILALEQRGVSLRIFSSQDRRTILHRAQRGAIAGPILSKRERKRAMSAFVECIDDPTIPALPALL